jgi:hypothetical protein
MEEASPPDWSGGGVIIVGFGPPPVLFEDAI